MALAEPLMMVSFTPSQVAKKPSLIYKIKIKNQKLLKKLVAHSRFSRKAWNFVVGILIATNQE